MAQNKINYEGSFPIAAEQHRQARMVPPGCALPGPGAVSVWVAGTPAPQGSKRGYARQGAGGKLHVSMVESSDRVKPWREDVRQACLEVQPKGWEWLGGESLVVKIVFVMPRRKADRPTKPTAPHTQKPDLDKLERAVLDAIGSAGVWGDDSQVVALHGYKRRAEPGEPTGAMIHIEPFDPFPDYQPRAVAAQMPQDRSDITPDTPETVEAKMAQAMGLVGQFQRLTQGASLPSVPKMDVE
jgi:crossover junction endodeoxyribonuclease RusA